MERSQQLLADVRRGNNGRRRQTCFGTIMLGVVISVLVFAALMTAKTTETEGQLLLRVGLSTNTTERPRLAVTSSLWSDHENFARYAMALGHSLVKTNGPFFKAAGVDMVMLTYPDIKFSAGSLRALESVGWTMRKVPRISPSPTTIEMYKENFGRINLWSWTEYSRVVYIDADTIVMGDISALFLLPAKTVAAVGDAWFDKLDNDRFNAGVLSLEPDMEDFVEMIASYRNDTVYQYEGQAEQGMLNYYFKHRITMLSRIYNFNLVMCSGHKALWDKLKADARIVHYTIYKPGGSRADDMKAVIDHGDSRVNKDIQEPLTWWWDVYEEMSRVHKWNGTFVR